MRQLLIILAVLSVGKSIASADTTANRSMEPSSKTTTPQRVLLLENSRSRQETVKLLVKSGQWQSSVLPGIKTADTQWLQVARTLYEATDAGAREDLDESLAQALLKAPYRVLPLLKEFWWSQSGTPCVFDEDSELPGGVEHYVKRLQLALQKTPPGHVANLRQECLHGIDATLNALRTSKHPG
jgi:hypothetical protein